MVRLTGPLFSEKAQKQLGHNLIYKRKGNRSLLTKYNKPGGANPFTPSASQMAKRTEYGALVEDWQLLPWGIKVWWNKQTKLKNLKMSGWNYFLQQGGLGWPVPDGLVGYWAFNRIIAGKVKDWSGKGNDGTPKPLYPSNYPHLVDSKNAKMLNAGSFDGIDDYVDCGNDNSLKLTTITWEAWVKPEDGAVGAPRYHTLVDKNRKYQGGLYVSYVGGNVAELVFCQDIPGNGEDIITFSPASAGNWYHVVGVGDTTSMKLYVNGAFVGGLTGTYTPTDDSQKVKIGGGVASRYTVATIGEVRVYSRLLSLEEIQESYEFML